LRDTMNTATNIINKNNLLIKRDQIHET